MCVYMFVCVCVYIYYKRVNWTIQMVRYVGICLIKKEILHTYIYDVQVCTCVHVCVCCSRYVVYYVRYYTLLHSY